MAAIKSIKQYNVPLALVLGEIGLVQNLGRVGIPICVGSEMWDNPSTYSRYAQNHIFFSNYTSPEFIDELCEFGKSLPDKAVLFSDDDHAILNIAQHQDRLEPYFMFTFPPAETVKKLLDKQLFCELIEQYDLPAPKSVTLSSIAELKAKPLSELRYPCIIKPSFKQAWWGDDFDQEVGEYQKAIKCMNHTELVEKYTKIAGINPHVVVQEFIEGGEDQLYSVNMYVGSDGSLRSYFIAQKLRTYPIQAGEGCYIVTVRDDEMIDMAMDVATKLELKGLLNIQFKRDQQTGKPVLLEVHTRNSVWSYLGTAAGANLAALYYQDLTGRQVIEQTEYQPGVTFIFLEKDIKAFLQNLKQRHISLRQWIGSYFGKFVLGGYKWNDPLPILMNLWFIIKRRVVRLKLLKTG